MKLFVYSFIPLLLSFFKFMNKKYLSLLLIMIIGLGFTTLALAQTINPFEGYMGKPPVISVMQNKPGFLGKVTVINGNIITMTGKQGPEATGETTYTVDVSNAKIEKKMVTISVSDIAVGDTLIVGGSVSGTSITATFVIDGVGGINNKMDNKKGTFIKKPNIMGTVSAISGTTITVISKNPVKKIISTTTTETSITYTVDASNATVEKNGVASLVSNIAVGDIISIEGTVSGTSIIATKIRDGVVLPKKDTNGNTKGIVDIGNGQPVVAGNVTVVNGATLTITNKSNVTYTIDTTNAKITKGKDTITISGVAVGDAIIVQGTVNGNSIVASSVIDQTTNEKTNQGFFGSIGSFFAHLFGF